MAKENQKLDFKKWFFQNFFAIGSFILFLLNIWLASKLAPLAEGIAKLDLRVSAAEQRISLHDNRLETIYKQVVDNYADILKELGNLKGSCER